MAWPPKTKVTISGVKRLFLLENDFYLINQIRVDFTPQI